MAQKEKNNTPTPEEMTAYCVNAFPPYGESGDASQYLLWIDLQSHVFESDVLQWKFKAMCAIALAYKIGSFHSRELDCVAEQAIAALLESIADPGYEEIAREQVILYLR
jgi:hypothetical protein